MQEFTKLYSDTALFNNHQPTASPQHRSHQKEEVQSFNSEVLDDIERMQDNNQMIEDACECF